MPIRYALRYAWWATAARVLAHLPWAPARVRFAVQWGHDDSDAHIMCWWQDHTEPATATAVPPRPPTVTVTYPLTGNPTLTWGTGTTITNGTPPPA